MRRSLYAMIVTVALGLGAAPAVAEMRVALLIGNKDYALDKLDLKNPHNDITHVAAALEKVGFEGTLVKDAGLGKLQIKIHGIPDGWPEGVDGEQVVDDQLATERTRLLPGPPRASSPSRTPRPL